jgi:hypothetical protein
MMPSAALNVPSQVQTSFLMSWSIPDSETNSQLASLLASLVNPFMRRKSEPATVFFSLSGNMSTASATVMGFLGKWNAFSLRRSIFRSRALVVDTRGTMLGSSSCRNGLRHNGKQRWRTCTAAATETMKLLLVAVCGEPIASVSFLDSIILVLITSFRSEWLCVPFCLRIFESRTMSRTEQEFLKVG